MEFEYTDHGRTRALERGISAEEVKIVLRAFDEEYEGWIAGARVRVGPINGGRVAVLIFPGDPIRVHSVWLEE